MHRSMSRPPDNTQYLGPPLGQSPKGIGRSLGLYPFGRLILSVVHHANSVQEESLYISDASPHSPEKYKTKLRSKRPSDGKHKTKTWSSPSAAMSLNDPQTTEKHKKKILPPAIDSPRLVTWPSAPQQVLLGSLQPALLKWANQSFQTSTRSKRRAARLIAV